MKLSEKAYRKVPENSSKTILLSKWNVFKEHTETYIETEFDGIGMRLNVLNCIKIVAYTACR